MQPIVHVGWLRRYYASHAAAEFKEDSVDFAEFSKYQIAEKNLENKVTRQGALNMVKWKLSPDHDSTWGEGAKLILPFPAVVEDFQHKLAS
jgi:hypothetical protein